MIFSKPGEYAACEMFSIGHLVLFICTVIIIVIALHFTKNSENYKVRAIIKKSTTTLWILEIIKILFNLYVGNAKNPNTYLPLYYCSLILYTGLFSGFCSGKLKRIGDVFISTGAIIGGALFLLCPNTSLPIYPAFHYISIQSFIFHGTMLYLGILVNITGYINLNLSDAKYYAALLLSISTVAYIVNRILKTNFMFISDNFPNTPVEVIYKYGGILFTPIMILIQVFGPFYVVYYLKSILKRNSKPRKFVAI